MALWLCSYVAMWLYGYVAMWLCGYVDKLQKFKFQNLKIQKVGCTHGPEFSKFLGLIFPKIIFFQDVPIYFLIFFKVFWYNKGDIYGSRFGHYNRVKN